MTPEQLIRLIDKNVKLIKKYETSSEREGGYRGTLKAVRRELQRLGGK